MTGNATANVDFSSKTIDLYFAPLQLEQSANIAIFDDDIVEDNEVFIARLLPSEGGEVREPSAALVYIHDDEGMLSSLFSTLPCVSLHDWGWFYFVYNIAVLRV